MAFSHPYVTMPQSTIYRAADRSDGSSPSYPAVATYGLARLFGGIPALVDVSLRLERGRTLALTGPNGAGKTTLLRLLATAIRPSFGRLEIEGLDAAREAEELRARIAFLSHATGLYEDLTLTENLRFAATLRGLAGAERRDRVSAVIARVGLTPFAADRVRGFSAGMRRRAGLARLLLAQPSLVLLDEPYAALDTDGMLLVDQLLGEWRAGSATCVIASHASERASAAADAVARLEGGMLVELVGHGAARTTATVEVAPRTVAREAR